MWSLIQRVLAFGGLLLIAPVLLVLAIAVVLDSGLPVLYRGSRIGRGGVAFRIVKLRTMRNGPGGSRLTLGDDVRVTRVGRHLRRYRLDELPQLWNIVRGEMALVGPRPEAPEFVNLSDPAWREILSVRPGLTGLTQLRHLDEGTLLRGPDPERVYRRDVLPAKIDSDLEYVRDRSVLGDLGLLAATVRAVVQGDA
jgi:lipopolysaccharide/colanic/teichoic acid biosynthesis glycosyltransferase